MTSLARWVARRVAYLAVCLKPDAWGMIAR
jgi:hypothetical protein